MLTTLRRVRGVNHCDCLGLCQVGRGLGANIVPPPEEKRVAAASGDNLHAEARLLQRLQGHRLSEADCNRGLVAVRAPLQPLQFKRDAELDGAGVVKALVRLQVEGFSRLARSFSRQHAVLGGGVRAPEVQSQRACRCKSCSRDYARNSPSDHQIISSQFCSLPS